MRIKVEYVVNASVVRHVKFNNLADLGSFKSKKE